MVKNWAENIVVEPRQTARPGTRIELETAVRNAQRHNRRVRAMGSAWSFSDCWVSEDCLVDTSRLKGILAFSQGRTAWGHPDPGGGRSSEDSAVLIDMLKEDILASDRRFAHIEAGIVLADLIKALDEPVAGSGRTSWALPTMGGAAGQSLAGAISTGTHGGDFDEPPIADMVRAIHIISADGVAHWIERAAPRNITDPVKIRSLNGLAGAFVGMLSEHVHYDDELFDAALVSMGRLGVIYAYVIEVREQYGLSQRVFESTWNEIRPHLMSGTIFDGSAIFAGTEGRSWLENHPDHPLRRAKSIGFFVNPYRIDSNYDAPNPDRSVLVQTQAEAPVFSRPSAAGGGGGFSNAALNYVVIALEAAHALDVLHSEVNRVIRRLRDATAPPDYKVAHSVLNTTSSDRPPILSFEMVVSTADNRHVHFLDRLLDIFDDYIRTEWRRGNPVKFAGAFNLRFTGPSDASLGMQSRTPGAGTERFCHIEFIVLKELRAQGLGLGAATGAPELPPVVHGGHHNLENVSEEWMRRFEQATSEFDVRMHWGQMHRLDRARAERGYPDMLPSWRRAATRLVAGGQAHTFRNDFSQRCGLEPYTEVLTATSWGPNRFDVFAFDERGEVLQFAFEGGWAWHRLGNSFEDGQRFIGPLTATSWGRNRLDVFGIGQGGALLQLWWNGGWRWTDLSKSYSAIFRRDISLLGPLAAAASEEGRIELFGLARTGTVRRFWYDHTGWHASDLGNGFPGGERFIGSLAAVSDGSGRIHVFGLGRRGQVLQLRRTGGTAAAPTWAWHDLRDTFPPDQIQLAGPLTATSPGSDRLDLFARTTMGRIVHLFWRGGWHRQEIETNFPGKVVKIGMPNEFGREASVNDLYRYDSKHCAADRFVGPISAVSSAESQHIFGFGESGNVLQLWRPNGTAQWTSSDHGQWWDQDEIVSALVVDIRTDSAVNWRELSSRWGPIRASIYAKVADTLASKEFSGEWPNASVNTQVLSLPAGTRLRDVKTFGINLSGTWGFANWSADNESRQTWVDRNSNFWTIGAVSVAYVSQQRSGKLLYRCGDPLWTLRQEINNVWEVLIDR